MNTLRDRLLYLADHIERHGRHGPYHMLRDAAEEIERLERELCEAKEALEKGRAAYKELARSVKQ